MRHCEICKKTSRMVGTRKLLRGHYNPTNWSRKYPNLQMTALPSGHRVLACTQCIKSFGKEARLGKRRRSSEVGVPTKTSGEKAAAPAKSA